MSIQQLLKFISPNGKKFFVDLIQRAYDERGSSWIDALKEEYPMADWIVDLIINQTAENAYAEIRRAYPNYPVYWAKAQLINFHGELKTEIERIVNQKICL